MKVSELMPSPYNPRKITAEQSRILKKALDRFGDLSGIVFNVRTQRLVSGHQRRKHLDPGWEIMKSEMRDSRGTVAVGHIVTPWGALSYREVDWDEATEKAANIVANKAGGEFDLMPLKYVLAELNDGALDMELTGFDADELKALMTEVPEIVDPDDDDEPRAPKTVTCPECSHVFTPESRKRRG
jgi:hypothetical protein